MKKQILLVGCGNSHDKRIRFGEGRWGEGSPESSFDHADLWLHDRSPDLHGKTAYNFDLNDLPYPLSDEQFDEIHAYEVLEHCGRQGDGDFFFAQFNEFWRALKPGGYMCLSVPMWDAEVAWGVPDHCRVLPPGMFGFLTAEYYENVGTPGYGDYRHLLKGCYWETIGKDESEEQLHVVLLKPREGS